MIASLRGCLSLLLELWRVDRRRLLVSLVLMIGNALALPLSALALGALVDAAVARDTNDAVTAAAAVAVLTIAALTLGHFAHIVYFELGELNTLNLERQLVDLSNGSIGLDHHERPDYADRFQVLRQEIPRMGWSSTTALMSGVSLSVGIVITAVLLARVNPWLLLLPLAAVPPVLLGRSAEAVLERCRVDTAHLRRRALHLFKLSVDPGAGKELRVSGVQSELRRRHLALWNEVSDRQWRAELRAAALRTAGLLTFGLGYGAGTLLVVHDAVAGRRSIGAVVLAITLAVQVNQQVVVAVSLLQQLQRTGSALENLRWARKLVGAGPRPVADAEVPQRIEQGIRLRGVTFRYPSSDTAVLSDVDLLLPAGSTVAILGENGAGKSTLVKLLCRFYEPAEGAIEIDGTDLRRIPAESWRRHVAAGFQDFARLEFLARETVGVGDLPRIASTAEVTVALERARGADVIDRMPSGLESPLGLSQPRDGVELSGGQWQKLALGRAMMRTTPLLLVLDEPTASLDAESEHQLFTEYATAARRIAGQTGGITLLVSHRFSTAINADLILVVEGGRVAESGDHQQLMAAGGLYAELYGLQAEAYR
ncbi:MULTISPECIES: ABC transporter ATP-binding protein [unclassified Micromonospora]|uniref:ABC transporter ATP-binding protein n=1 Tax=unclassified Micromonospora TaxID=2617518 RepID=UPI00098D706F|nr:MULTISPECIES: ABC transporter ATP-binding protein [unclassified Micromonospora]MDI5936644.1 ABC transporter ATP-binding protein [Micromonospora sp. DH15]OON32476.1 hypothetical protein BSA16_05530 [Micromonospora sp. Rc5]